MEGTTNPSYSPETQRYSSALSSSSPTSPKPRQRIPQRLNRASDAPDSIIYRSSWVGMDEEAVKVRSGHIVWRVFRLVFLGLILAWWLAMFIAAVVVLAQGEAGQGSRCLTQERWFDTAIGYQIVPASFQDSDGDGYGDIKGIISRLDYLEYLGVETIWLASIFQSAHADLWRDVTDFTAVDGVYGTMQDFEDLIKAVHDKGMKLILEFIPNHSSDQHPWFEESRQGTDNDYSDYYIWADGTNFGPRPYTVSNDGDNQQWSWEYDSTRRQWYLYSFIKEEPDLNYRNPAVVSATQDAMRFWLEKGVDGFYMRHVDRLIEPWIAADSPVNTEPGDGGVTTNKSRQDTMTVIAGWRHLLDEYDASNDTHDNSKLLVIDTGRDLALAAMVYSNKSEALGHLAASMPFNFMFLDMAWPLNGHGIRVAIETWMATGPLGSSRLWTVGWADESRSASRYGEHFSRALLFLMMMLPGSPLMYYGDELGMTDGRQMNGSAADGPAEMIRHEGELTRSPMQWSPDVYAGFTDASTAEPWTPVGLNATRTNVELQRQDNNSTLAFIERAIQFRIDNSNFFGIDHPESFRLLTTFNEVLAVTRELPPANEFEAATQALFAAVNVAQYEVTEDFESRRERVPSTGIVVVATDTSRIGESINFAKLLLRSGEAILIQYEPLPKLDGFSESIED